MVVARFVKWSGAHIAVKPGQTPSTGYMRMLLFQHYAGRTPHMRRSVWSGKLVDRWPGTRVTRKDPPMVQKTTGSDTAEKSDPAEDSIGSVTTETTDGDRDEAASKLVDRFSLWSGAAGLIPLPIVDIVAVGGVQLEMLRRLSDIYGVPFVENRGKSLIASLAGSVLPASTATTTAMGITSALKSIPGNRHGNLCIHDAGVLCWRHLCDRQGLHSALRFGRDPARLQSARLSRIHQGSEGKMEFPICCISFRSSTRIHHSECVEHGRGAHDFLTIPL